MFKTIDIKSGKGIGGFEELFSELEMVMKVIAEAAEYLSEEMAEEEEMDNKVYIVTANGKNIKAYRTDEGATELIDLLLDLGFDECDVDVQELELI